MIAILDEAPTICKTPKPRRTHKVREQLEDSFLRRSKRLSIKSKGFKDAKSARKARESTKEKVSANAKNKLKKAQKGKKHVEVEEECRTRFSKEDQALTICVPRMSTRHI